MPSKFSYAIQLLSCFQRPRDIEPPKPLAAKGSYVVAPEPITNKRADKTVTDTNHVVAQSRSDANKYRDKVTKSKARKSNSESAKRKPDVSPSRFKRLLNSGKHKMTDLQSAIEKKDMQSRVAGWGVGTVRTTTPLQFKRSERTHTVLGFTVRLFTPEFFKFRSKTIDRPFMRQAGEGLNVEERVRKRRTLGTNYFDPLNTEYLECPTEKKAAQEKDFHFLDCTTNKPHEQVLRDTSIEGICSIGGSSSLNGPLATILRKIHGKLQIANNNLPEGRQADEKSLEMTMRTLSLAVLAVAKKIQAENPNNKLNEGQCQAALEYLETIQLNNFLARPVAPVSIDTHSAINARENNDIAWRIAYELAETPTGFNLLKLITEKPDPVDMQGLSTEDKIKIKHKEIRQDVHMQLFMKGANALLEEDTKVKRLPSNRDIGIKRFHSDPSSLISHCVEKCTNNSTVNDPEKPDERKENTLLIKALPGLQYLMLKDSPVGTTAYLTEWQKKIQSLQYSVPLTPQGIKRYTALSESTWAVNALRNGFITDVSGSDFDKVNKRLEKATIHVDRALEKTGGTLTNNSDKGMVSRFLKPLKLGNKSVFSNGLSFKNSTNGPLIQREKMTLALQILEKAICETGDTAPNGGPGKIRFDGTLEAFDFDRFNDPVDPVDPADLAAIKKQNENEKVITNIARIVMLRSWLRMPPSENISGYALSAGEVHRAESSRFLDTLFTKDGANIDHTKMKALEDKVKEKIDKLKKICLTPKILKDWAATLTFSNVRKDGDRRPEIDSDVKAIPKPGDLAKMTLEQMQPYFFDAITHLETGMDHEDHDIKLEENTRKGITTYVSKQVKQLRLGSSVKMSDGASLGFGLQGLSAVVSRFSTAFVASARGSLSASAGRVAQMEIGVNAAGGYARFGVQTEQRKRAGGGGSLLWGVGAKSSSVKVGLGVAADIKGIHDTTQFEGVNLRLNRLGGDITGQDGRAGGVAGDADMTDDLSEIVKKVMNGRDEGEEYGLRNGAELKRLPNINNYFDPTLLEQLLEDNPNLSVSWIGKENSTARTVGATEQAGGIAGVFANGGGVGASVFASSTQTSSNQQYKEQKGSLTSRVISSGHRIANSVQASVALGIQGGLGGKDPLKSDTLLGGELATAEAEVYRSGITEEIHTVDYMGVLQPRTYKLIIHANAETFIDKVSKKKNLTGWAHTFAEIKNKEEYGENEVHEKKIEDRDERRAVVVRNQMDVIQELLVDAKNNAHPNVSHIEYLEIKEDVVKKINRLRDLAIMSRKLSDHSTFSDETAALEEAAEKLLTDENNYTKRFLFSIEKQTEEQGHRFNFLASFKKTREKITTVMTNMGFWG